MSAVPPPPPGRPEREALERWLDEIERWRPRVNLTTVPRAQAWQRHVEETLTLLAEAAPEPGARVADLGSGAGVPGIPVAVLRPDVRVVLIEADARRAGFLTHVAGMLDLGNVEVAAQRAEVLGHTAGMREAFDLVVSRATAPAATLCELALPLLRPGGALVALVADGATAALSARAAASRTGGGAPVAPGVALLRVPKLRASDPSLPRRPGVPARRPLG